MVETKGGSKLGPNESHRKPQRRRVLGLGDMTVEDMEAISKVEMDPKWNYLNEELKDWKP